MSEAKFIKGDRYVGPNGEDLGPVKTEKTEDKKPAAKADAGK